MQSENFFWFRNTVQPKPIIAADPKKIGLRSIQLFENTTNCITNIQYICDKIEAKLPPHSSSLYSVFL